MQPTTYREAYIWASSLLQKHQTKNPKFEAELLLRKTANIERHELFLKWDEVLTDDVFNKFQSRIYARCEHKPIQYITNQQEFYGRNFYVDERVLIPRPETEILIEQALTRIKKLNNYNQPPKQIVEQSPNQSCNHSFSLSNNQDGYNILDIGTGSGAIAITLALEISALRTQMQSQTCTSKKTAYSLQAGHTIGLDISIEALQVANGNAKCLAPNLLNDKLIFIEADVWPTESDLIKLNIDKFHFILSNPPYVDKADAETMDIEVKAYEPETALFADQQGLAIYKKIIESAGMFLHKGGWLGFECGYQQANILKQLLNEYGFVNIDIYQDLAGHDRVIFAQRY